MAAILSRFMFLYKSFSRHEVSFPSNYLRPKLGFPILHFCYHGYWTRIVKLFVSLIAILLKHLLSLWWCQSQQILRASNEPFYYDGKHDRLGKELNENWIKRLELGENAPSLLAAPDWECSTILGLKLEQQMYRQGHGSIRGTDGNRLLMSYTGHTLACLVICSIDHWSSTSSGCKRPTLFIPSALPCHWFHWLGFLQPNHLICAPDG